MLLKNKFFNEIIEIFTRNHYFNYNFLISSLENENFIELCNDFFSQLNEKQSIQIEKYEFFGEKITADEIREIGTLTQNANLHSYYKFIIIHNIEKILQNSTNILLKIIEEPNSPVIFFFTAQNIYNILPTIKSRCFQINLNYLEKIYNDIHKIENISKSSLFQESQKQNNESMNTLIHKDKNTKDEEILIQRYIERNFFKFLRNKRAIHKTIKNYEYQIKQIKIFHCNKKHLFNEILMKLKTAIVVK